jgi:hydrogenase maturation protease
VRSLVIGLGNPDRGDDGVGPAVARRVAQLAPVVVVECVEPGSLMDAWEGADAVVIVDAMASGRTPGAVTVVDAVNGPLPAKGWAIGGTHALGLPMLIDLARSLDRLPPRLKVVGVEIHAVPTEGPELSPAVSQAIEPAARAVLQLLRALDSPCASVREQSARGG